ncbi:MAG: Gfo/Idh/MocA family protein [Canibacter sp.]
MVNGAKQSPTANKPTIGMLGGGFMARTHTHAAKVAGAELRALGSSTAKSSERAAAALHYAESGSVTSVLNAGVDVVHVCTPNNTHAEYTRAALKAGAHVICEKPLAVGRAEAAELVAALEQSGRVGTVPFVYRYHPLVREARARIASGDAGAILTVSGTYLQDWLLTDSDLNWRVDAAAGGPSRAFADIGSHLVDMLEFVTGERIERLVATTRTVHKQRGGESVNTEDTVAVTVELSGGGVGTLLVSQVAPGRKNSLVLEIGGSSESLRFEQERPEQLWVGRRSHSELIDRDAEVLHPDAARLCRVGAGHPQGYQDAFNSFIADSYALMMGEHREGVPTFADGLRAAIVTDAVLESVTTNTWVEVENA